MGAVDISVAVGFVGYLLCRWLPVIAVPATLLALQHWHLPGDGPQPYAVYVDETDAVWLSDWGAKRDPAFRSAGRGEADGRDRRAEPPSVH